MNSSESSKQFHFRGGAASKVNVGIWPRWFLAVRPLLGYKKGNIIRVSSASILAVAGQIDKDSIPSCTAWLGHCKRRQWNLLNYHYATLPRSPRLIRQAPSVLPRDSFEQELIPSRYAEPIRFLNRRRLFLNGRLCFRAIIELMKASKLPPATSSGAFSNAKFTSSRHF